MAWNQGGEVPARQDVAACGDACVAEAVPRAHRAQVEVSGSQGVLVGDGGTQVNNYNYFARGNHTGQQAGGTTARAAGRLLIEVTNPFDLEVHRPLKAKGPLNGADLLPAYVERNHDRLLAQMVRAAAEQGKSGIAVLTGGSSTGKTRACWEALGLLRERAEPWRLCHPISPSRPKAVLEELSRIGPQTVVWLNEAQFYLLADGGAGERVAAGLRDLLRDRPSPQSWSWQRCGLSTGPGFLSGRRRTHPTRTLRPASCWQADRYSSPTS
jgi:hypothetical protein